LHRAVTDVKRRDWVTVMGSFIADLTVHTPRLPGWGQTVLGSGFRIGPGGKGSNQAVAAARLGGHVCFIGAVGRDPFGELARRTWREEGVDTAFCADTPDHPTGSAAVLVHEGHGENAIVVDPGSGLHLTVADVDRAAERIATSAVFVTQLEIPVPVVEHALALARCAGALTILNPAPAAPLPAAVYRLCDFLTPNESEAAGLAGFPVATLGDAERAADVLLARGAGHVVVTLGARGALVKSARLSEHVPAVDAGPVVETTGAGDAFNGALAIGLVEGMDVVAATRFACAAAGISVTRPGTSASMPRRGEVEKLVRRSEVRGER
jgi:ribokinase